MFSLFALLPLLPLTYGQYTATYTVGQLPDKSEGGGQTGTNNCGTTAHQDSSCQNAFINSIDDFCLWGPPALTSQYGDSSIGNVEQIVVSYCLQDGYGTRLIPEGTITGAHFVKVVNDKVSYVQVTGQGDMTKILIPANDDGGELDPHSDFPVAWTGLGNPEGGLVFTNAFTGGFEQTHEWTSFMSGRDFCFRACRDGPNAAGYCEHIYDVLSCGFTIPGSHDQGFDQCDGNPTDEAPGVYDGSTFHQGDPTTPAPHPPGATYNCQTRNTIGGGSANIAAAVPTTSASASRSASANSSVSLTSMSNSTSASMTGSASSSLSASASITSGPSRSGAGNDAVVSTSRPVSAASAAASPSQTGAAGRITATSGGVLVGALAMLGLVVL